MQLAVIGGTGVSDLDFLGPGEMKQVDTVYDTRPVTVFVYQQSGKQCLFLPRHGINHATPPHRVNYRANIAALATLGAGAVVALNAVGGIHEKLGPGAFAVPDQLVDYTWGRQTSFFDGGDEGVQHTDFTWPFDADLRKTLVSCSSDVLANRRPGESLMTEGVYGVTQGPRLETAAEIRKLRADGCDMVGMTLMPEAVLARERGLAYACLCLSVNWAAGLVTEPITMEEIGQVVEDGRPVIEGIVSGVLAAWAAGTA